MKNIGIIGCGDISDTYIKSQKYFNNINFVSCADINLDAATKTSKKHNITLSSVDEIILDDNIDIILNLTNPQAHYDVTKKALEKDKHVYCEKPMSVKFKDARELLDLANRKNLYLGNAPDTFLGGGGQKSREIIDSNFVGDILTGNFVFAFPGVQDFHSNPESWFQEGGGPVIDMGPYFFTTLVNLLGSAKNVRGRGVKFFKTRKYKAGANKGKTFEVTVPTSYDFSIEFKCSAIIQGFLSFDVLNHKRNHMELYGTSGSIIVPDPNMFGGPVLFSKGLGSSWEEISVENKPLGKINIVNKRGNTNEDANQANYRGIGLSEMIDSMESNRKHRCNGELSLHVLDIIECIMLSSSKKTEINLRTSCPKPDPIDDNYLTKLLKN